MASKPLTAGPSRAVHLPLRVIGHRKASRAPVQSAGLTVKATCLVAALITTSRKKSKLAARSSENWQELVRRSDVPQKTSEYCASWSCSCAGGRSLYPYEKEEDYFQLHPAAKVLAAWCKELAIQPSMWAAEPMGYRTRGKLAVALGPSGVIIGLFKRATWKVLPVAGCVVNHSRLMIAVERLQQVLNDLEIRPFDHDASVRLGSPPGGAIRYVELTLERQSGLVQLVIVWNGSGEKADPELEALLQELWASKASSHSFWHSIWVHWRDPDPQLLRAIHSKRTEAWQQLRPCGQLNGHVVERLDGLDFSFGPASFQQVNLQVFEKILQDMKLALMELVGLQKTDGNLRILELCSGVGVIGLSLAHAASKCKDINKVSLLSTDVNPNCADLFHENAKRTFPQEDNCEVKFTACTAAEALSALGTDGADVLVIDPPRRGLADKRLRQRLVGGEDQAAAICNSGVQAVIYMSCGHDSFMADAERFMAGTSSGAFRLKSLSCYDMFPYTPHLETLGIFLREKPQTVSVPTPQLQVVTQPKLQCQFIIGIEQERDFNVKQRLLGTRGHHMKLIAESAECKLRLRGRGSGFKEGPQRRESRDPLMLCVSSKNESKHRQAVKLVRGLVEDVYEQYRSFKSAQGEDTPKLQVQIHDGPRPGSRTKGTT